MKILGLLGGVASGKSLVARQLAELGAAILDADRAGHEALRLPNVEVAARQRWGDAVFGPDGHIDRPRLARIVFAPPPDGPKERKFLESLTHPEIARRLAGQAEALRTAPPPPICSTTGTGSVPLALPSPRCPPPSPRIPLTPPPLAILDAALILEAGWDKLCDCYAFIDAPREVRTARALSRGWTERDFAAREAAQDSLDSKRPLADFIIDNSGSAAHTQEQVQRLWQSLVG